MTDGAVASVTVPRGRLRVYLGAAPGVGKTFKMLEEGRRRLERGTDVVVGIVETHGRARTAEQARGFEVVPRRSVQHRGAVLQDMDLDAVLARKPAVVLVDELAHTNAPGLRHEKRWQDVEEILEAGIDVVTTLNIQHLESLNDALTRITGVEQRETIPDDVVRRADQVELVDMAPEALRRRIVHGNVYPRDRVDAALGNYFRVGNLTALRELALLWVADRVDEELLEYRHEQGIRRAWETRERIVVALTGSTSGEVLIRRAARIAERSRAELLGVHVRRGDGLGDAATDEVLAEHRRLLADLGGSYHELAGDDPAAQLVAFARSHNATQLVLGNSQRRRLDELLHGSVINDAVRASPDIDVHVVAHVRDPARPRGRRRVTGGRSAWRRLPARRRWIAMGLALVGPPLLTLAFVPFRYDQGLPGVLPAYMLLVVGAALVGGTPPALVAAVVGFALGNAALTQPYGTLRITELASVVGLLSFLAVAALVAVLVGRLGARTADAERARAQARALAAAAATVSGDDAVPALLDRLRSLLGADLVAMVAGDEVVASAGDPGAIGGAAVQRISLDNGRDLVVAPVIDDPDEAGVVRAFADQLVAAMLRSSQAASQQEARALAELDRFRTALLRSVSHDLRTPLASIKAAASSLQQDDVDWPDDARAEFLATIIEEGDRLDRIVGNLLDASRIESGVLAVDQRPVHLDDLVARVVGQLPDAAAADMIRAVIPDETPAVLADPALLERVLENLLSNAVRHAPGPVEVDALTDHESGIVRLRVIDHGPGVPPPAWQHMFGEFQRLTDHGGGVGLGLSVSLAFVEAMGGALEPAETPGGGLTMDVVLPIATGG
jgi:two-component system sensor histidine kinase KdpD